MITDLGRQNSLAPAGGVECRAWDFAATKKTVKKKNPDFSATVKIRVVNGVYYILDCLAVQDGPAEVEELFRNVALQDARLAREQEVRYAVRWEIEPGAAAIRDSLRLTQLLAGLDAYGVPAKGDKLTRARPLAAQARAGNVKVVAGGWNEELLSHLHHQPDLAHDDIMDAASLAFNAIAPDVVQQIMQTKGPLLMADPLPGSVPPDEKDELRHWPMRGTPERAAWDRAFGTSPAARGGTGVPANGSSEPPCYFDDGNEPAKKQENPLTVHYDGEEEPKKEEPKKTGIVYESDDGDVQVYRHHDGTEVVFDDRRDRDWASKPPGA
jgi:predicted phage terminase large subunit-like protein